MKAMPSVLVCLGLWAGCGALPHKAEFITDRKLLAQANLEANGILAFEVTNHVGVPVEVDFVHGQSQRKYRISLTPAFSNTTYVSIGPFNVFEKAIPKDVVSDSVALFQLPSGTYTPAYVYSGVPGWSRTASKATGTTFEIAPGKITSAGRLEIVQNGASSFFSHVRIESGYMSIEPAIRGLRDANVGKRDIQATHLTVAAADVPR